MSTDVPSRNIRVCSGPEQEAIVSKAIGEINNIATLPEVTLQIIKLVEDPNSTAQDLNKLITNDPALGARILKVINSAFYGLAGQIASINRATVLLGLNAVKNIAIVASLAKLFRGGEICPGFNARALWAHSVAVATAARQLAEKAEKAELGPPDEAFLAGLIHDVGIMVEIQALRSKFVEAFDQFDPESDVTLRQVELNILGATHEQFGAALCRQWNFPSSLVCVTGFHHRPLELTPQHRALTCLVYIADIVAARAKIGMSASVETEKAIPEALEAVKLTPQTVEAVCDGLPESIFNADHVLRVAA